MTDAFSSGRSLARWTVALLIAQAVAGLAAILSDINQIGLVSAVVRGRFVSAGQLLSSDTLAHAVSTVATPLLLATGVLFCLWTYRAHRNLPALGAAGLEHTPGWAAGSFFVPIINLYRPFQVMREIWKASDPSIPEGDANAWRTMASTAALGWWWACWLLRNVAIQVGSARVRTAVQPRDYLTALYWNLAGHLFSIAGIALLVWLLLTIDRRQAELHQAAQQWHWETVPPQP